MTGQTINTKSSVEIENLVKTTLENVRLKLLDLSRRNTLLNFKETKRSIRIIDELPEEVYRKLVIDNASMEFLPYQIPDDDDEESGSNEKQEMLPFQPEQSSENSSKKYAHKIDIDNVELPKPDVDLTSEYTDKYLQTPFVDKILERRCKTISRNWRTGIEEAGINYLFLAIGFLEWRESGQSDIVNKAPLILIPLRIERGRLNKKSSCYNYTITYSGEDIETNLTLSEKLESDFGLTLPSFDEDFSIEKYFEESKNIFDSILGWRVAREMIVGFFSFAKLRLFKDLSLESWPKTDHLITHKILQDILIGRDKDENHFTPSYNEEYDIDDDPSADQIPLVLNADSSQHSAIIDVVHNGKSLVIEGPPGTGKSQTIANIIAASLYSGKSILFVSEKKAALEVVRNRLNALGLGDFCLELHSHKTQKGLFHSDIERRLLKTYVNVGDLEIKIRHFNDEKKRLQDLYTILLKKPAKTGQTIYEIIGSSKRWKTEIETKYLKFEIENPLEIGFSTINSNKSELEDFIKIKNEIPNDILNLWKGFEPDRLLPGDNEKIKDKIIDELKNVESLEKFIAKHKATPIFSEPKLNHHDIEILSKIDISYLENVPDKITEKIAVSFLDEDAVRCLKKLESLIEKYNNLIDSVRNGLDNYDTSNDQELHDQINALKKIESLGYGALELSDINNLIKIIPEIIENINFIKSEMFSVKEFFLKAPNNFQYVVTIINLKKLLDQAPSETILHHYKNHGLKLAEIFFERSFEEYNSLVEKREQLSETFKIDKSPNSDDINQLIDNYSQYYGKIKRIFSLNFRNTKKEIKKFLNENKFEKNKDYIKSLNELSIYKNEVNNFENLNDYIDVLGPDFKGINTNWNLLKEIITWSQLLLKELDSESCSVAFLSNYLSNKEKIIKVFSEIKPKFDQLINKLPEVIGTKKIIGNFDLLINALENKRIELIDSIKIIPRDMQLKPVNVIELIRLVDVGIICKSIEHTLENNKEFKSYFLDEYKGIDTDTNKLRKFSKWVQDLNNNSGLGSEIINWIFEKNLQKRSDVILLSISTIKESYDNTIKFINYITTKGVKDLTTWLDAYFDKLTIEEYLKKLTQYSNNTHYLIEWSDYLNHRRKIANAGLQKLLTAIEEGKVIEEKVSAYYLHSLYYSMFLELMVKYSTLANFTGVVYDNVRNRIAELDDEIKKLNRKRIAFQISKRSAPVGISSGYIRDYTELGLITHELNKKKRHIPLRQLVKRSGKALQALKPCFMMSPQSVAQYLVPGNIDFDILVMDEASQLRLEDALGAVARSQRIVVVGDPKQLPPTSFFERIDDSAIEDEKLTAAEESESILDICQNFLINRRLRWHYRSEHDELIAFSNSEFYDNDLIVFPSPFRKDGNFGVHYNYIDDALYYKGKNIKEAKIVASYVLDHYETNSDLSLGVATFNIQQRDLIQDEIERLQKENSWFEEQIKRTDNSHEPFFVKNLENVQGDERDVIFISTTYGPDKNSGKVYQRFGPLNRPTGWRRLNVLITRAKKRVEIFSSMTPSDIIDTPQTSLGVRSLKGYLEYAKIKKIPEYGEITGKEPDSDFEIAVAKSLHKYGYRTEYQIGVAGFFIDIGVYNPNRSGEFILGIECDGAIYHSGKSIRDRDILRQRILESKGWVIHRVWSTDWFKNKQAQLEKLLKLLDSLVLSDKHHKVCDDSRIETKERLADDIRITTEDFKDRDKELCDILLEYRAKILDPITEDRDRSLLSDEMINIFLIRKPISREEFLELPLSIRENVEIGQMQYANEIFELIEEYSY